MLNANYNVIGMMSGTSLDGVDLAHIKFSINNGKWSYEIKESETIPYTENWINQLKNGIHLDLDSLQVLDKNYTELIAEITNHFILKNKLQDVDFICSHGHTILHQPQNGITLQIGNLPELAQKTKHKVICDFRVQDVAMGGQGAPLVPIGDQLLFSEYDFCLNLGGFSNISFNRQSKRIAFDISPVNTVLNFYAEKLGHNFDQGGSIAKSGELNKSLYDELNNLPFYSQKFPKSLGFEFVHTTILPIMEKHALNIPDLLYTFTEHIAYQIGTIVKGVKGSMLITGGGAYNTFLIERIKQHCTSIRCDIPNKKTIEFKEALIFGLLGVLRERKEINTLASVTGAKQDHCSGKIFLPN
ncbi:MAG: anhydro-N-acetylmuramic acid kinase [Flavobacterium sp.]